MRKMWMIGVVTLAMVVFGGRAEAGGAAGKPTNCVVLPSVSGWAAVCVWDSTGGSWIYNSNEWKPAQYDFTVPEWSRWYWVGVYDFATDSWLTGTWVAHFKTAG